MAALRNPSASTIFTYKRGPDGEIMAEEKDEVPVNQEEGFQRWKWEMEMRFIRGQDDDFDYNKVDSSDLFDDLGAEDREADEIYFDDEEPDLTTSSPRGETGIQDF